MLTLQNLQFKLRRKENNLISTDQIKFEYLVISRNTDDTIQVTLETDAKI
jgi:hypothetical protein